MGKQPFISHAVNGYSRYDMPENKAFSVTPGIIYPVRIQFVNARDRVTLHQGIDVRSNPLGVPSFNPYVLRLHRFWVPMQLYHPEMRVNSSKFDMNDLSYNFIPGCVDNKGITPYTSFMYPRPGVAAFFSQVMPFNHRAALPNSLMSWLRIANSPIINYPSNTVPVSGTLSKTSAKFVTVNADTYLGYWDIVRNYYSYSSWGVFSFAHPGSYRPTFFTTSSSSVSGVEYRSKASYFWQRYGSLEFLDHYFETMFYPRDRKLEADEDELSWNRSDLFIEILRSDLFNKGTIAAAPDFNNLLQFFPQNVNSNVPAYPYDVQAPTVNWNNGQGADTSTPSKVYFAATLNVPFWQRILWLCVQVLPTVLVVLCRRVILILMSILQVLRLSRSLLLRHVCRSIKTLLVRPVLVILIGFIRSLLLRLNMWTVRSFFLVRPLWLIARLL